jgi:hypothetical protein
MRFAVPALLSVIPPACAAVDFDREIRPILSDNCFSFHGPDAKNRMAGLRLDTSDGGAFANGLIVAGNSIESRLYQRIGAPDPAKRTPPVHSGHTLNPQQIELVKPWIDQGAKWQTHWAFEAPKRPELPNPKEQDWARNPTDRFILAKLDQEGLAHSPEAAKATLLRRVTYDLTGLPPTIPELDSFLAEQIARYQSITAGVDAGGLKRLYLPRYNQ